MVLFFPEITSGYGWGGPVHDQRAKNIRISARIAYDAAVGGVQTSHQLVLTRWGFSHLGRQTERERIPRPRKNLGINSGRRYLCAGLLFTLRDYAFAPVEVQSGIAISPYSLDGGRIFPIAKKDAAHSFSPSEHQPIVL